MNYPNRKATLSKATEEKRKSFSNRGMELESDINKTNSFYLDEDIAVIHKKPTPVRIVKVSYPCRAAAKITEAYYQEASTTDYNGIYKAKYIDFEAKECASKSSFPFSSIHPHQIEHLNRCLKHGAIAFIILRMTALGETYLIKAEDFIVYYKGTTRKSLPYSWIKENGYPISFNLNKPCDYLKTVDKVYGF